MHNANGNTVRMIYDPLGRRIGKTQHNAHDILLGETRFTWDGLRLLQEHRFAQTSVYIYADNSHEPLARVDGSGDFQKVRYYHNDLNGLPEQLTEANGHTVWQARYQVWGNTTEEVREPYFIEEQNLRFQGQYLDRETGLHYNTFRFYDPDVGTFTTPDPIGLAGGINFYAYAPNPVGWVDPLGLAPVNPKTILVSQDSINPHFDDGSNLNTLKHRLISSPDYIYQVEPIRKVRMSSLPIEIQKRLIAQGAHKNSVFTLDNRRLYVAKEAGISKIPSRWASQEELSQIKLDRRFSTKNGGKSIRMRSCAQ